jgi:hypothetical protein
MVYSNGYQRWNDLIDQGTGHGLYVATPRERIHDITRPILYFLILSYPIISHGRERLTSGEEDNTQPQNRYTSEKSKVQTSGDEGYNVFATVTLLKVKRSKNRVLREYNPSSLSSPSDIHRAELPSHAMSFVHRNRRGASPRAKREAPFLLRRPICGLRGKTIRHVIGRSIRILFSVDGSSYRF